MRTTDVEYKRMALEERIKKLEENPKDIKCGGPAWTRLHG